MNRIYIAGPCTGLPEFNYPAFHAEAARLRELGFHVENPAENPAENTPPPGNAWADYMRLAISRLLTCDTVALLSGWHDSKGAKLEYTIAMSLGMLVVNASSITASVGSPA